MDKPDYITVTVDCTILVTLIDYSILKIVQNAVVNVEIIKASGERVSKSVTTNDDGIGIQEVKGTFKVYREQPITCIANIAITSVEQYPDFTFNSVVHTIPWSEIYPAYDFGDSALKHVYLDIQGVRKEN